MIRKMKNSGIEWIGDIPEAWRISRIKYVADFDPSCDFSMLSPDSVITYTPMENIKNGYYIPNTAVLGSLSTSLTAYRDNDIVMAKVTPCFENGNIAVMSSLSSGVGLGSSELFVFRVKGMQTRYLFYWLQNHAFVEQAKATMTGTGGLKRVSPQFVRDCAIHCPPVDEQSRIADFLDIECAQIDAVIEQTRASIEEYKKLKQSVITEAVTKGIRPSRKMKASGVEWIGEIPEEWSVFRVANLYDERNERGADDLPILTVSINTGISDHEIPDEEKDRVVVRSEDRTLYKRVCPGDLAYNMMRAWQGAFGAVRVEGMVSPAYVVAKPKTPGVLDSRYVEALLRTPSAIEEMHRYSRGITDFRLRLYWPEFKNIRICVPPIEEQIEIADCIDTKAAEIETLIVKKQRFLDELEDYKKSMIFEYVTGKKEVV